MKRVTEVVGCLLVAVFAVDFSVAVAAPDDKFDGPSFRKGLWQFERTLERLNVASDSAILRKEQMTRCVDPTEAMKETFKPMVVGSCHSAKPERTDKRYVFPLRCDYMGPVRTEIDVESDNAYTEINELTVGRFPRRDTVVAHRVGECDSVKN